MDNMKTILTGVCLVIGLGFGTSADALTITTTQGIEARWSNNGGPVDPLSDQDGATGPGTASANVTSGTCYDPSCVIMSGFQAGNGTSYLGLEVGWADSLDQASRARIEAQRKVSILNEGSGSVRLSFDYELKDMSIDLFAGSGGPTKDSNPFTGASDSVGVQIGYSVFFDGVKAREHSFTIWGGFNAAEDNVWFDWLSEGGLGPTMLTPTDCIMGKCGGRNASFESFSRSLDLGRFSVGEGKEIETRMWAEAIGYLNMEWDAQVRIGDPSGMPAPTFTVISDPVSSVPLPGSALIMLAGFGAMVGLRRSGWQST
jgi:hypothetical protein